MKSHQADYTGPMLAMRSTVVRERDQLSALAAVYDRLIDCLDESIKKASELDDQTARRGRGRKQSKPTEATESQFATKDKVLRCIKQVLTSRGPMKLKELRDTVTKELDSDLTSFGGFPRIFDICVKDKSLTECEPGVYDLVCNDINASVSTSDELIRANHDGR